jgi:hypothetical protein
MSRPSGRTSSFDLTSGFANYGPNSKDGGGETESTEESKVKEASRMKTSANGMTLSSSCKEQMPLCTRM